MTDENLMRLRAQHTVDGALDDPEACDKCCLLAVIERLEKIVKAEKDLRMAKLAYAQNAMSSHEVSRLQQHLGVLLAREMTRNG